MTLEELNTINAEDRMDDLIRVTEARQVKNLSKIADIICAQKGKRLVLLAGASSAGKTTTATRLCIQLEVNNCPALHLSTDDYFVGDARNPRDEQGHLDYEHVDCVDIPLLAKDINALLKGETIARRRFDFVRHKGFYSKEKISLPSSGIVVLEGIHALNPRLTTGIPNEAKFRVFIEPQPDLEFFAGLKPTSSDTRFLRRLVRDNQFRKLNPGDTYRMWPNVRAGEAKWIEPFRKEADVEFNSYLTYELAVLKPYADGLLERLKAEVGDVSFVKNLLLMFDSILTADSTAVPGDSILRETIGGSQLDY